MNADPDFQLAAQFAQLPAQFIERGRHAKRGGHRVAGAVGVGHRGAPERHDRIADELVERAAVGEDDFDLRGKVLVQHRDHVFGARRFGERGEAANVGEQHADFAGLGLVAIVHVAAFDQRGDHARIEEPLEHARGAQPHPPLVQIGDRAGGKVEQPSERQGGKHRHERPAAQRQPAGGNSDDRDRDQPIGQPVGTDSARKSEADQRDQRQREWQNGSARRLVQPIPPIEIVNRGGKDFDPRISAAERGQPEVHQPRRGGADHHDLAAKLVFGALWVLAQAVEVDVRIGHVAPALAPVEQDRVLRGQGPAERLHDPRGERGEAPALRFTVQRMMPADIVAVGGEIDQPATHRLRVRDHRQRQHQRDPRIAGRPGDGAGSDGGRHMADPRAIAVAVQRHGQPGFGMAGDRVGKRGVLLGPVDVQFVEQDVERHRARLLRSDMIEQFAMNRARPRPASGQIVHRFERVLVDVDDHHPARLRAFSRVQRQQHVAAALVDDPAKPGQAEIEHRQQGEQQAQSQPAAAHQDGA